MMVLVKNWKHRTCRPPSRYQNNRAHEIPRLAKFRRPWLAFVLLLLHLNCNPPHHQRDVNALKISRMVGLLVFSKLKNKSLGAKRNSRKRNHRLLEFQRCWNSCFALKSWPKALWINFRASKTHLIVRWSSETFFIELKSSLSWGWPDLFFLKVQLAGNHQIGLIIRRITKNR